MEQMLTNLDYTPTEVREAVMLATYHVEMRRPPSPIRMEMVVASRDGGPKISGG
jgi:hypothetical protein